ncbi:hypothetical protein F5I97DRAFT_1876466 [Phlebopus sp. FC_14]|nr:hypothetical protein F5I97DRAFT_1876466 [Phlebopus sp. FC_14]
MAKLGFTLVLYVSLVLALVACSSASTLDAHRRDHTTLNRLIKKRAPNPQGALGNIFGSPSQSPTQSTPASSTQVLAQSSSATTASDTSPTVSAPSSSSVPNGVSSSVAVSPSSTNGGLLNSVVGGLTASSATSSSASSSSAASSFSSTASSSSVPAPSTTTTPASSPTQQQQQSQSIDYVTTSSAVPSPTQTSSTSSSSGINNTAMTVLIVVAASVGASIIIWTIIRKWKFRPSSNFEDRMQPIDWQPAGAEDSGGLPGQHRRLSNASSFHSGSNHGDDHGRGQGGVYGSAGLNPIPEHDFTAGPANLAPVGGYADLARGPSPQPTMQEALSRGPSIHAHYQHDQYGVPLHHGYNGRSY